MKQAAQPWGAFARAARGVPPAVRHGIMAAAVLCVLASVLAQSALATSAFTASPALAAPAPAVAETATEAPRTRCRGCGGVEGIRPLALAAGGDAGYEFTIRLRDGSLRTSTTVAKGTWQVGDRIILMGGVAGS